MYITKLGSNRESFREIEFENGKINIILGKKTTKQKTKTVNGVGKTLSLKMIDYCLGSSSKKHSELKNLENWEFYLDFKMNGLTYQSIRDTKNKSKIYLNNREYPYKDFNKYMENNLFEIEKKYTNLSYRNLISRFLRVPKSGYNNWEKCKSIEDKDVSLINNGFLLDLDIDLIDAKANLKEKINTLNKNKKIMKSNDEIKEILNGADIGVNISSIKKEISNLEKKIDNLQISEGYNSIKESIESDKYDRNGILNKITTYENILKNINASLKVDIDVTSDEVISLYKQAKVVFSESVVKKLNEVSAFHQKLLESRKNRLRTDKSKYSSMIQDLKKKLSIIDKRINTNLEYLKDKGSLAEFKALQLKITDMKIKLNKMTQYKDLISEIEHKVAILKGKLSEENIAAIKYINENKSKIDFISSKFKEYVDFIYQDSKVSGISITNNDGNNKLRFDIKPEIKGDGSAGINNVKTFCIDMLYLTMQNNHNVGFVYHDNTIFSETDPRQVYNMFILAKDICEEYNLQYIVNLNYDMYDTLVNMAENEYDDEVFAQYLKKNVAITLLDNKIENKLLGVEIK